LFRQSLRGGDTKARAHRQVQVAAAIRFCGILFGSEYAALMSRAAENAEPPRIFEPWRASPTLSWGIVEARSGEILGGCGLHHRAGPGVLDIGYWLRPEATGRGYVTATAGVLTSVAFDTMGAQLVRITCAEDNIRSAAVPRRLGFTLEETLLRAPEAPGESGRLMIWSRREPITPRSR